MKEVKYLLFFSEDSPTLSRSLNDERHPGNAKDRTAKTEVSIDTRENKERGQKYKNLFSANSFVRLLPEPSLPGRKFQSSDLLKPDIMRRHLNKIHGTRVLVSRKLQYHYSLTVEYEPYRFAILF